MSYNSTTQRSTTSTRLRRNPRRFNGSKVAEKAKEANQDSTVRLKVEHGKIMNSEVGFVNKSTDPDYSVFITDMNMDVNNLGNRLEEGTGIVKITGKFMGSGSTEVYGAFRLENRSQIST